MALKFGNREENFGSELQCPNCGSSHLHQKIVDVYERHEDARTGLHAQIKDNKSITDANMTDNPSPRRQGMLIHFNCEECTTSPILKIFQHKGTTYMDFQ